MNQGIYLIRDEGQIIEMVEQPYDSEDLLQSLLARYPSLLAGDQIDCDAPRRWLLVSREAALPSSGDNGAGRWWVDHLFLDQDGIPTLVEVKRSSDTRIRREVIGQMLDYAAGAVMYWSVEEIRTQFDANCERASLDPEKVFDEFLGAGSDQEQFWQATKTNLQAGRVRMIFVSDEIPSELRRVVEFLNNQMDPAEVLAIEVKQYVSEGLKTIVPRVIGQTEGAKKKRSGSAHRSRQWDEHSFFSELEVRHGTEVSWVAREILKWAKNRKFRIWWGKGSISGSFFPIIDHDGESNQIISVWTYGTTEIQFQWMKTKPPFDSESVRMELLRRLNEIPGITLPADAITRRPNIPLSAFKEEGVLQRFLETLDWAVQKIETS